MPNVVASPMTPWMDNELSIPESPQKRIHELIISSQRSPAPSPRFSQELRKLTKVYLSEKQSGKLQELGMDLPCAPPATPAPEMYEKYEYVPSMADIRVSTFVIEGPEDLTSKQYIAKKLLLFKTDRTNQ